MQELCSSCSVNLPPPNIETIDNAADYHRSATSIAFMHMLVMLFLTVFALTPFNSVLNISVNHGYQGLQNTRTFKKFKGVRAQKKRLRITALVFQIVLFGKEDKQSIVREC